MNYRKPKIDTKIDIDFIELYLRKKYSIRVEDYFSLKRSAISNWRKVGIPNKRLFYFIEKEKSNSVEDLFKKIYP